MISYSDIDILPITTTIDDDDDDATSSKFKSNIQRPYHNDVQKGASFQRIRGHAQYQHLQSQLLGTWKDRAVQWEERAKQGALRREAVKKLLQEEERYLVDNTIAAVVDNKWRREEIEEVRKKVSLLLDEVVEEFEGEVVEGRKERDNNNRGNEEHWSMALKSWDEAVGGVDTFQEEEQNGKTNGNEDKRPGFIVLGMHRSGTSMLSGLLVEGFGYETGGPLIMPNFDNEKVRLLMFLLLFNACVTLIYLNFFAVLEANLTYLQCYIKHTSKHTGLLRTNRCRITKR